MSKPIMIMMVGLVGSGKSHHAENLSKEIDATVFSSDKLREEMFGDVNEQSKNSDLFQELHRRIKECLKSGKNAIYDATNISSKRRKSFLQELNKIDCEKRCIVTATPYEQCLANNAARDRKVPEDVIDRMYRSWNTPATFEGFDKIETVYWEGSKNSKGDYSAFINKYLDYSQDNPHHTKSLGEHCYWVSKPFEGKEFNALYYAACLHDCGKPHVKAFANSKGEPTSTAHYYGHENCGAYDALFYFYGHKNKNINALDVSLLINLHMTPYYWEKDGGNEKLHNKYKKLWGEELYNNVMKLHEADKAAH